MNNLVDKRTGAPINLSMQRLVLTGDIYYPLGALVQVAHQFKCSGTEPMEAIYVAALPTGAALRRFKIIGSDFEVDSKLEKRAAARASYENGLADGHLSVLAETNQDGVITLSVGQVQPDEQITVLLDVVVGVDATDKGFQFRYPFTLAPSYHSKAQVNQTPSGLRMELPQSIFGDLLLPEWKTGREGLHEVSFDLRVHAGLGLAAISSPSHRVSISLEGADVGVKLAGWGDTPNRDLVLDISVDKSIPTVFSDNDRTRWSAVVPSTLFPKPVESARRICFLIDRSGSMSGSPLAQAKAAVTACLSSLTPEDDFGIAHFGGETKVFDLKLGKATKQNLLRAGKWVAGIECDGGTEMLGALNAATQILEGEGDIFLLTDGEVFGTGAIVEQMAGTKIRVHVLGIGTASQHRFMSQLARRTVGVSSMVSPDGDVGGSALSLFQQIRYPVITNAHVQAGGRLIGAPVTVWDGRPLVVTSDKDGSLPTEIRVGDHAFCDFSHVSLPQGLVGLLWAGRELEDLTSKLSFYEGTPLSSGLKKEMEDISLTYGLASPAVSLVAVVHRLGDQAGVTPEQILVPLGFPEGMDHDALVCAPRSITRGFKSISPGSGWGRAMGGQYTAPAVYTMSVNANYVGDQANSYLSFDSGTSVVGAPVATCAPAAILDTFWAPSGSLWGDLGSLQGDGGLPGTDIHTRVVHTAVMALITRLEAAKVGSAIFNISLSLMSNFIHVHMGEFTLQERVVLQKVKMILQMAAECRMTQETLRGLFTLSPSDIISALHQGL